MNEKTIGLVRTGGVIVLFIIGVFLILKAMGTEAMVDTDTREIVEDADKVSGSVTYALALVWISLGLIGLATIWGIIQNPKRFIPTAIGIGVFAVIALIGYSMASDEIIPDLLEHPNATADAHKMGGAGIKTTFILTFVAVALIAVGSVMGILRYFKK